MDCSVIKCRDCGTIMVINNEDLWKLKRCTKCESSDITFLEEDLDEHSESDERIVQ